MSLFVPGPAVDLDFFVFFWPRDVAPPVVVVALLVAPTLTTVALLVAAVAVVNIVGGAFGFDCSCTWSSLLLLRLLFFWGGSILRTRGMNALSASSSSSSSSPTSGSRARARGVENGGRDPRWAEGWGVGGLVRGVLLGLAGVSDTSKSTLTPADGSACASDEYIYRNDEHTYIKLGIKASIKIIRTYAMKMGVGCWQSRFPGFFGSI